MLKKKIVKKYIRIQFNSKMRDTYKGRTCKAPKQLATHNECAQACSRRPCKIQCS